MELLDSLERDYGIFLGGNNGPLKDVFEVGDTLFAQKAIAAVIPTGDLASRIGDEQGHVAGAVCAAIDVDCTIRIFQPCRDFVDVAIVIIRRAGVWFLFFSKDTEAECKARRLGEERRKVKGCTAIRVDAEVVKVVVALPLRSRSCAPDRDGERERGAEVLHCERQVEVAEWSSMTRSGADLKRTQGIFESGKGPQAACPSPWAGSVP